MIGLPAMRSRATGSVKRVLRPSFLGEVRSSATASHVASLPGAFLLQSIVKRLRLL